MKHIVAAAAAFLAILACAGAAAATPNDDLSQCLVRSAGAADQTRLKQWMFALFALNPAVKADTRITPAQREAYDRQAAAVLQRLLTADCRAETVAALKDAGPGALESSIRVIGEVAFRGLMSDPGVSGGLQKFTTYIDPDKLAEVGREAGIADQRGKMQK